MGIGELWNQLILEPLLNGLIVLYAGLFQNFGLTIIMLTIIVRLVLLPLTLKQLHSSRAMQLLQPKMQELQKKYAKNRQKLQQETMKLYREAGVNPMGCLLPLVIQLPIWIALYQSIIRGLAVTPDALLELSQHLYSWSVVHQMVPLEESFLWLNLAERDPYFILPVLVAGTMWVQQKMITTSTADPRQQSMSRMMLWMMPIMFGYLTTMFPSGLAIYWVTMNIVGIVTQYFVTGWGGLAAKAAAQQPLKKAGAIRRTLPQKVLNQEEKRPGYGKSGSKRKDSRRGY